MAVKVLLRNPKREIDVPGPLSVHDLLVRLDINPEGVLVIRGEALAAKDEQLADDDTVEIRPVVSGGNQGPSGPSERGEQGPSGPAGRGDTP